MTLVRTPTGCHVAVTACVDQTWQSAVLCVKSLVLLLHIARVHSWVYDNPTHMMADLLMALAEAAP